MRKPNKKKKIQDIIDNLYGAFGAICLVYGIKAENPTFKTVFALLKELEYEVMRDERN